MKRNFDRWEVAFVSAVFLAGLALRIRLVFLTYLNPDEALHAVMTFGDFRETLHNALRVTHPPLLAVITYLVSRVSKSEEALRMVPLLCGSLFPLLIFFWVRRMAGSVAAMVTFLLLMFAPNLIALSAQLRSYTLAFLFLSAAILVLDEALTRDRWQWMAAYSVLLWLGIVSDYSVAWFVAAAGVYVLLRAPARKGLWAAGQLVALLIFGCLYTIHIRRFRNASSEEQVVNGWLRGGFPHPGEMLQFPIVGAIKQFAYLVGSNKVGGFAAVLFAAGIVLLWTGRTSVERGKARALAVLLTVPFLLGISAAYFHLFPFGATRQSAVMGVLGAIGIGFCASSLPRSVVMCGMLLMVPFLATRRDRETISLERDQKEQIAQCIEYMRANIPPDAPVFSEGETFDVLSYYTGMQHRLVPFGSPFGERLLGNRWRVATRDYTYEEPEQFLSAMAAFRDQYGLRAGEPIWVLDGGWSAMTMPNEKLRFTRAVRVYQAK